MSENSYGGETEPEDRGQSQSQQDQTSGGQTADESTEFGGSEGYAPGQSSQGLESSEGESFTPDTGSPDQPSEGGYEENEEPLGSGEDF